MENTHEIALLAGMRTIGTPLVRLLLASARLTSSAITPSQYPNILELLQALNANVLDMLGDVKTSFF